MTTNQPESLEARLNRLESIFAGVGEQVAAHNNTIDVLVANIQQLTENVNAVTNRVDVIADLAAADRAQAAEDRQQAAIDRQEFRRQMEQRQREIQQIWEYLRDRNGGSSPPA